MDIGNLAHLTAVRAPLPIASAGAGPASAATVERLAALLQEPGPGGPATPCPPGGQVLSGPCTAPVAAPVANPTLGERILEGMQGVADELRGAWSEVATVLDGEAKLTVADLLRVQVHLAQMSLQYDLVGKAISRSTQNLEQLVKVQ